ncbi:MAG TPA: sigmaK-factor processing regulatory BofA [Candidatus Diapherotrites archaeon]|uniref:SigmaK-factor processing regulatory BofA n=1 Tax=Candidatus Iainarchaeum sp. TaxID=3101447 RepID=A0A7J4J120_9ARCH|nr:sigmaK-factor processing regulatory BofA [Candidatus Diapherotrites archaeon]
MANDGQLGPIITIVILAVITWLALTSAQALEPIIINSIIGIVMLVLLNFLPFINIRINIWSVLIAGLGGIAGIVLLIVLGWAGIEI